MATIIQKMIIRHLSSEGSIVTAGRGKYTVRDEAKNPVYRCAYETIFRIKPFLKKKIFKASCMWHLNKAEILKLRKNHSFKKIYLEQRMKKELQQTVTADLVKGFRNAFSELKKQQHDIP